MIKTPLTDGVENEPDGVPYFAMLRHSRQLETALRLACADIVHGGPFIEYRNDFDRVLKYYDAKAKEAMDGK